MMDDLVIPVGTLIKLGDGCPVAGRKILRAMIDLEIGHEPVSAPAEKPENVRAATEADEEDILSLIRLDFYENARNVNTLDEQKIRSFVETATRDNIATIGVIDGSAGVVAMIFIEPESCWWTTDFNLAERVTFVDTAHRSTRYATDLLNFAKWMADSMSKRLGYTVFLTGSVVATRDARRKAALFGRHMHFVGATYCFPQPKA